MEIDCNIRNNLYTMFKKAFTDEIVRDTLNSITPIVDKLSYSEEDLGKECKKMS